MGRSLTLKARTRSPALLLQLLLLVANAPCCTSKKHSHQALPNASDLRVRGLEDVEPAFGLFEGEMYAGLLPMDNDDRTGNLMFWLFAPEKPSDTDSLVIWLNGGPGCSAFFGGLLVENSPVTIPLKPAGSCCMEQIEPLVFNQYAWTNATSMLYIEQPVGTGFSTGDPPAPTNETDVAGDMYAFLQNFYKVFDQYAASRLYIFGESYAGMYVPGMGRKIYLENEKLKKLAASDVDNDSAGTPIALAGIALGNGWIDARVQGPATIDFAYWHGMMDEFTRDNLHAEWEHCISKFNSQDIASDDGDGDADDDDEPAPFHKFNIPDDCSMMTGSLMAAGKVAWSKKPGGPNTYDVTTWDPYPILQDISESTGNLFYNNPRVKKAINAPDGIVWRGCIPGSGRRRLQKEHAQRERKLYLQQDRPISMMPYIAELLDDAKIQVLIYNGDRDLSTCAQGSEMLLNSMEWSGASEWNKAPRSLWVVGDDPAGYSKRLKGLEFLVVYNSGHLVPYNQPVNALDLITRVLKNKDFGDHKLPSFDFGYTTATTTTTTTDVRVQKDAPYSEYSQYRLWLILPFVVFGSFITGFVASGRWQKRQYSRVPDTPPNASYSLH